MPIEEDKDEDYTQEELIQFGGISLVIVVLVTLLLWALNKALTLRRRAQQNLRDQQALELKEIRRCLDEGGRKIL